mgnify:CR=1 FL=1
MLPPALHRGRAFYPDSGAEVKRGTVVGLADGGVVLEGGEIVEGDAVVIAMGPWSILASRWLPLPGVGHAALGQASSTLGSSMKAFLSA